MFSVLLSKVSNATPEVFRFERKYLMRLRKVGYKAAYSWIDLTELRNKKNKAGHRRAPEVYSKRQFLYIGESVDEPGNPAMLCNASRKLDKSSTR